MYSKRQNKGGLMEESNRERQFFNDFRHRERERENSNSNSKTLFYKDCSLGSVKQLVLARLLMNRYQIKGIIYKHIGMNE